MWGVFKVKMTEKQSMLIARSTLLVIAAIAIILARDPDSSVFKIVSFAWAGFGAAFGPVVLFALFWKRANKWGALCGMISGGVLVFVWKFLVRPLGGAFDLYELLPAFPAQLRRAGGGVAVDSAAGEKRLWIPLKSIGRWGNNILRSPFRKEAPRLSFMKESRGALGYRLSPEGYTGALPMHC